MRSIWPALFLAACTASSPPAQPTTSTPDFPLPEPPRETDSRQTWLDADETLASCGHADADKHCDSDADCGIATFNFDCCGSELKVGLHSAAVAEFDRSAVCEGSTCAEPPPPCVVRWVLAEDGGDAAHEPLQVSCVEGACRTSVR